MVRRLILLLVDNALTVARTSLHKSHVAIRKQNAVIYRLRCDVTMTVVNVRRFLSKLISEFALYCCDDFENTLSFCLNRQHFSYFVANLRSN